MHIHIQYAMREIEGQIKRGSLLPHSEALVPLCVDLENAWRDSLGEMDNFNPDLLLGDWEMIYCNSGNMRRWGSLLNTDGAAPLRVMTHEA